MCYYLFMITQDIEALLSEDESALGVNDIPQPLLAEIDDIILRNGEQISKEAFGIYNKFVPMKQDAPEGMKNELFLVMKNYIKEQILISKYADALFLARFLIVKAKLTSSVYSDIAEALASLGEEATARTFISLYQKKEPNKPLLYLTLGNFYNLCLKDYKNAIKYYEQYLKIDETKPVVYTILGSLYAKVYGEYSLKDQIYYYEKAYKLKPNDRLILHTLAFGYEKLNDVDNADKFYRELLKINPTETDYYNYCGFLIRCGDFKQGYKYLTHRFNIDDVNLRYPLDDIENRWNFEDDISQKSLLVMYEQGYGDTFMYCRFVPALKKFAKRVVFVVQESLYDLLKSSPVVSDGIEIYPESVNLEDLKYDVHMALIDVPYVLGINSDEIPYRNGYLKVDDAEVLKYGKENIKSSGNIKVGIAYQGNRYANYNGRDIELSKLQTLFKTEGFDFYSFTMNDKECENLIPLGGTFKNFTDTACALKNMDLIISTDNVVLNLAGALGVKTFGLFNRYPNFRWFKLTGEDVGWYKSVKPYQTEDNNYWSDILIQVRNELVSLR